MAERARSLLFLILAVFAAGMMQDLTAQGDNVAAVMSDFALPEYKNDGKLFFILYGKKAVNTGVYIDLMDPIVDVVTENIPDTMGIQPWLGMKLYPLQTPLSEVTKFWREHPFSRYLISADTALYEKNRKTIRSSSKVHFRSPGMDVDGVGFDVDLEQELIHIRSEVEIHLRSNVMNKHGKQSEKESPEK